VTGKPCGLDLREHKVTLPLIHALRGMSAAARQDVDALFESAAPSDAQIARVIEIVGDRGGLDYARKRGLEYAAEAEAALAELPETAAASSLRDAIAYALDRSQ
jgi:octaprenyl-diphosphate synthase